jgi:hypothetical protein
VNRKRFGAESHVIPGSAGIGMGLVFTLLTKGVRQPGHASHAHPHGEILSFYKAG